VVDPREKRGRFYHNRKHTIVVIVCVEERCHSLEVADISSSVHSVPLTAAEHRNSGNNVSIKQGSIPGGDQDILADPRVHTDSGVHTTCCKTSIFVWEGRDVAIRE
jgi:hypothetical protein